MDTQIENHVQVKVNTNPFSRFCNCCSYEDWSDTDKLYEIRFPMGNSAQVVFLCEKHLDELRHAAFDAMTGLRGE